MNLELWVHGEGFRDLRLMGGGGVGVLFTLTPSTPEPKNRIPIYRLLAESLPSDAGDQPFPVRGICGFGVWGFVVLGSRLVACSFVFIGKLVPKVSFHKPQRGKTGAAGHMGKSTPSLEHDN